MTNPRNAQSLHAASDDAWAEAVRREAVIRPLAAAPRLSKAAVGVAARALGLSASHVYGLLRVFRRQPVTASPLPTQTGPTKGTRRLAGAIEAKIDAAIKAVYLKPERPTLRRTLREVRQDCRDAGLRPPSIKRCVHGSPRAASANGPRHVTAPTRRATAFARCMAACGRNGCCRSCRSTTPRSISCWSMMSRGPASGVHG